VQIETPAGGVAVADWAGPAREVLVKSDVGPFLSTKPWAAAIPEPGAPCQNIRQRPYR
jgi:phosphoribosyl-dephospho-CoA transferase